MRETDFGFSSVLAGITSKLKSTKHVGYHATQKFTYSRYYQCDIIAWFFYLYIFFVNSAFVWHNQKTNFVTYFAFFIRFITIDGTIIQNREQFIMFEIYVFYKYLIFLNVYFIIINVGSVTELYLLFIFVQFTL